MSTSFPTPEETFGTCTIPEALERAARTGRGIRLVDRSLEEHPVPFAELAEAAVRGAGGLRRMGTGPADRVCLLGPTSRDLLAALFACWRAGAVPIVLPLPRRASDLPVYLEDVGRRVDASGAAMVLAADVFLRQAGEIRVGAPVVALEELAGETRPFTEPLRTEPDDVALLQFTSGTTATPRAVTLTHRQILSNLSAAGTMAQLDPASDVIISWLPLFHDMGLIGMLLGAVSFGVPLVLEPTEEFLGRPGSWLDAISSYGGTVTASPNFGYGLAARDLAARPRSLDLSRWRVAANGAEPVDLDTVRAFEAAGASCGLRPGVMSPMFGLAEATLAVSIAEAGAPVSVRWVDRDALETAGSVEWSGPEDPSAKPLVSCGHPIPGTEVAIFADGGQLTAGTVGEICVRGPSVMQGYWCDPEATADAIRDGWLHTGDLGFWSDDGLVVCGREKDVIILGGRNIYPEDYEFWTERVPGVRRGNVIAFAIPASERMVVVAETTVRAEDAELVARETLETLRRRLPRGPEEVVLVAPGTLPKTSSGKRQRGACRERYACGDLDTIAVAKRSIR